MIKQKTIHLHDITFYSPDGFDNINPASEYLPEETFKQWCHRVLGKNSACVSVLMPSILSPNKRMKNIWKNPDITTTLSNTQISPAQKISAKDIISICEIIMHSYAPLNIEYAIQAPDHQEYDEEYGLACGTVAMRTTHLKEYCEWLQDQIESIFLLSKTYAILNEITSEANHHLEELGNLLMENEGKSLSRHDLCWIFDWANHSLWETFNSLDSEIDEEIEAIALISEPISEIFTQAMNKAINTIERLAKRIISDA